jgi:hypothetical protein
MFKNLSYKQKFKLLIIVSIVAVFLCYLLAVRRTIEAYSKYTQMAATNESLEASPLTVDELQNSNKKVNALFDQFILDTLQSDKNLIAVASNYCKTNGLELKEYKPVNIAANDSIEVLTRTITIEGGFVKCLKLLYVLETGKKVGKVSSVEFKSYTDPQDKKVRMDCTIYIQNLISYKYGI